jgi:predicted DsbA family dithiol-disulfide isomerase
LTAHRLLWLALHEHGASVQAALTTALFDAHFRDGTNIADHARLTELAEPVGLDGGRVRDFLATEEGSAEVHAHVAAARREGVTTVPTFVFGNGVRITGVTSTDALGDALRQTGGR